MTQTTSDANFTRRDTLKWMLAGAAVSALPTPLASAIMTADRKAHLFDISLAQWSLNKAIFGKKLDAADFPKHAKEEFGITNVEYVNQFYKAVGSDEKYWKELRKRCDDLGTKSLLIMCDGEGDLGDPDEKLRTAAVENHKKWAMAAKILGCHSIRVNAASTGTPDEQRKLVADGLRRLTEWATKECDQNVIVENHGGLSSNGAWLASVMKAVDLERCGTLPDFGNFKLEDGTYYDRYKGVEEMMPFAKAVSAKSHDFDAEGQEIHTDYKKMLKIVVAAGYKGCLGIEYEGKKMSEPDGIRATKKLLEKIRTELEK